MLSEKRISIISRVNSLTFLVYVLLIFEGALRKWAFPQFSTVIFFIKDPFVIYIYALCFYYKLYPRNIYFTIALLLALLFSLLMSLQALLIPFNILAGIYGWRTYFFYLPLAFIIGSYYSKKDLIRIARFTCLVAIPIAVLTYIQYKSPFDSYINKNVGLGESQAFTVIEDIVRPSGTFSFTTGQVSFISSLLLMLFFNFFLKKDERFLSPYLFFTSIFAFFTSLAVSGSRGAYVSVLIILAFLLLASFILINKKQGFNILAYSLLSFMLAFLIFYFVFDKEWDIITRRQELAEAGEGSILKRMLSIFINFEYIKHANFLGYGLGLSSGGGSFLVTGKKYFALAEGDWARNILEAGIFSGTIYVFYRIFLSVQIINEALKSLLKSKNPMPVVFLGFVLPSLLIGSITGNGTSNVYNWLFVGFSLALNRVYLEDTPETNLEE